MDITNIVIYGTLGMLLLAMAIVAFVFVYQKKMIQRDLEMQKMQAEYQKELLNASIEAQEKERKRIAQDLHDDIGAMLSTIKLGVVGMLRGKLLDGEQAEKLESTKELIDETVTSVRQLSRDLLPATLDEFGLGHALEQLFEKIEGNSHLHIEFYHDAQAPRLPGATELALYRVVQELCNNIIKHANASKIEVGMVHDPEHLEITMLDDGDGFVPSQSEKAKASLGLKNIESRLNMIDADINYELAPEKGTKVSINMGYLIPVES